MISSTSLNAYRSHELSIQMQTSSGDTLSFNFQNTQELSLNQRSSSGTKEEAFSFKSLQSFSFEMKSNGISEQDQKEIDAFMKQAKPYIDTFMKELTDQHQTTPLNKIASDVTSLIGDLRHKDENTKNHAKNGLLDLFDNAIKDVKTPEKLLDEAQSLIHKILSGFDRLFQPVYA